MCWLLLALVAAGLSACGSISERMPGTVSETPGVGLPSDAPARSADALAYPAVHDMPPPRNTPTLTSVEQKKFEDDLLEARNTQQRLAGTAPAPTKIEAKKTAKDRKTVQNKNAASEQRVDALPAQPGYIQPSSSRSIY